MKREDKQRVVEELHGAWSEASAGVVTHYRGLSVSEMGALRRSLRQEEIIEEIEVILLNTAQDDANMDTNEPVPSLDA